MIVVEVFTTMETYGRVGSFKVEATHGSVIVIWKLTDAAENVVEPDAPLLAIVIVFETVTV